MVNEVTLIGNTGDDIKMHYFDNGGCVGNVSLATSSTYTSKATGEKVTDTQWHSLVFRNKAAETAQKYVSKGDRLYIRGSISYRKWTDDKGIDRYHTEINVLDFKFLTPKGNRNE